MNLWFGYILRVLFYKPVTCSTARSPGARRWKLNRPVPFTFSPRCRRIHAADCKIPTIYCLHNFAFVHILSSLVKQKRILFVLPGWGQRVPGQIKGSRLRRTFGKGDNGAQRCPNRHQICSRVFLDPHPGTVRGMTCPSVSLESLGSLFCKKAGLFWGPAGGISWFSRGVDGKCCTGGLDAGQTSVSCCLRECPCGLAKWHRCTGFPGCCRCLRSKGNHLKPFRTSRDLCGAQSYVDATSGFARRVYFAHICGDLGKYKSVW